MVLSENHFCRNYLYNHFPSYPICDGNIANTLTHVSIKNANCFLLENLSQSTGRRFAKAINYLRCKLIKQQFYATPKGLTKRINVISPHSPNTVANDIGSYCKKHPYGTVVIDFDDMAYTQSTGKILSGFLVTILTNHSCTGVSLKHNYFIILANQNIRLVTLSLRLHTNFTFTFSKPTKSERHQKAKHTSTEPMYLVYKLVKPDNPSVPRTKVYLCKTPSLKVAERIRVALQGDPGCHNKYFKNNPSICGSCIYSDKKGLLEYGYDYVNRALPLIQNPEPFIAQYSKKFIKNAKDYQRYQK